MFLIMGYLNKILNHFLKRIAHELFFDVCCLFTQVSGNGNKDKP